MIDWILGAGIGPVETVGAVGIAMLAVGGIIKVASRKPNGKQLSERVAVIETSFQYLKEGQVAQWKKLDTMDEKLTQLLSK